MKVGDYVRTEDGRIGKIIQEEYITPCNDKHRYIYLTDAHNEMWYDEETIIKSNQNIIDLIEVGDIIKYKTDIGTISVQDVHNSVVMAMIKSNEIEVLSIVTKEQFESMEYKIN